MDSQYHRDSGQLMLSVWAPRVEVFMLTWLPLRRHAGEAWVAGEVGVLSKSTDIDTLLETIVHVLDPEYRQHVLDRPEGLKALRARDPEAEERWARLWRLSPREVEVLEHLSQGLPSRDSVCDAL